MTHVPRQRDPASRPERLLAALATRQHGVVGRRQLLDLGLGRGAIDSRVGSGRLHVVHRGVYVVGRTRIGQRGRWIAGVLAYGEGAVLSHRSAAALWGLIRDRGRIADVTAAAGRRGRRGIRLHRSRLHAGERATHDGIPVTCVARTLLDLAGTMDEDRFERVFEEADRLGLLEMQALDLVCKRAVTRRGVALCRRLMDRARMPRKARSPLEERFARFCEKRSLPSPALNVEVLGREVDALWPRQQLIVELDGFAYHRHRAAFERDRARDAALQTAGYRVVRLTHRRMKQEADAVEAELRRCLTRGPNAVWRR